MKKATKTDKKATKKAVKKVVKKTAKKEVKKAIPKMMMEKKEMMYIPKKKVVKKAKNK